MIVYKSVIIVLEKLRYTDLLVYVKQINLLFLVGNTIQNRLLIKINRNTGSNSQPDTGFQLLSTSFMELFFPTDDEPPFFLAVISSRYLNFFLTDKPHNDSQ